MVTIHSGEPRLRFLVDRIESEIARDYTNRNDENGNGCVDRLEFPSDDAVFENIDQDQNERLNLSELKRYVDLLRQREPLGGPHHEERFGREDRGSSFSISSHAKLTTSVQNYFATEIGHLDRDSNDLLDRDELGVSAAEFSAMDQNHDNLISTREWAEGFVEGNTAIKLAIKAYRFGHGIFQNRGGVIRTSV